MNDADLKQWNGKSRGGKSGYRFFIRVVRYLGTRWAYFFLSLIVIYFVPFAPKATAAVWQYNRKRLKYGVLRSMKELYMHYYVFGQTLIDKIAIAGGLRQKYSFEFENYDRFLEIINDRSGAIIIGAHVGCWEAGTAFFGKYGKRINIVMLDAEHPEIKREMAENTREGDFKIIPVNEDGLTAMLEIKAALNDGGYVCFNGDRYLDREASVAKQFMGAEARFPTGPFLIASRLHVPVVFYFAVREPKHTYRFIFREAEPGNTDRDGLMDDYVSILEEVVCKYPRQWFNFYKFWNN